MAVGDTVPDLGEVADLDWQASSRCLASDGRFAAVAKSTNGTTGIVCFDAEGAHLIARSGMPAPDGLTFTGFSNCSFTDDGALIFAGSRTVPTGYDQTPTHKTSVYRADSNGFSHLFGDGDRVSNGTTIEDSGSVVSFVANARGSVLAEGQTGDYGLFLYRHDRLDLVTYNRGLQWQLSDDDEVVMLRRVHGWEPPSWVYSREHSANAVVILKEGRPSIAVLNSDPFFPDSPVNRFTDLIVRGDLAVFTLAGEYGEPDRVFSYHTGDGLLQEVEVTSGGHVVDVTPEGRFLERTVDGYAVVGTDGGRQDLDWESEEFDAFALNDRGNVGFYGYDSPPGSLRRLYQLTGEPPEPTALCPRFDSNAPTVVPTPTPTPAPIAGDGSFRAYVIEAGNGVLTAIDTATHEILHSVPVSYRPHALALSPDGRLVFVASETRIDVVDAASLRVIHSIRIAEKAAPILAAFDNFTAFGVVRSNTGGMRIVHVDGIAGVAGSVLAESNPVIGLGGGGTTLLTKRTGDSSCPSQGQLIEIDLATGATLRRTALDAALDRGTVDGTHAYIVDSCDNAILVVDLDTVSIVGTVAIGRGGASSLTVAPGGRYAYTTHAPSWVTQNPDGTVTAPPGVLSIIDLDTHASRAVEIPGGARHVVAATPDGRVIYLLAGGHLNVIDGNSLALDGKISLSSAVDVVIGPVPLAGAPTPAPEPRIIVRADSITGIISDEIDVAVNLEGDDLSVQSVEHILSTTWNAPLIAVRRHEPDCRLAPEVDATATFEFDDFCSSTCDQLQVRIEAAPGTSLPHGSLYSCTVRLTRYEHRPVPIILRNVAATDSAGGPLRVLSADAEIVVIPWYDATPRPTRSRPPTATPTPSRTPTPTPLPIALRIDSVSVAAGARGSFNVALEARGSTVAGTQNDIAFDAGAPIATAADGTPACRVNPEIGKSDSRFAFLPDGCDDAAGSCQAMRALVLSFDDVTPIADGSVLFTCELEARMPGAFALAGSFGFAADPSGTRLAVEMVDGVVQVEARPPATSTAKATFTPEPPATVPPEATSTAPATVETVPSEESDLLASQAGPIVSDDGGSGCSIDGTGEATAWPLLMLGLVFLARRRKLRPR